MSLTQREKWDAENRRREEQEKEKKKRLRDKHYWLVPLLFGLVRPSNIITPIILKRTFFMSFYSSSFLYGSVRAYAHEDENFFFCWRFFKRKFTGNAVNSIETIQWLSIVRCRCCWLARAFFFYQDDKWMSNVLKIDGKKHRTIDVFCLLNKIHWLRRKRCFPSVRHRTM